MLLYPETDEVEAQQLASRLCRSVRSLAIPHADNPEMQEVTVSVGAAMMIPGDRHSAGDLLEAADRALYLAKQGGRDDWRMYEAPPPVRLVKESKNDEGER